jgi:hypothetical protein
MDLTVTTWQYTFNRSYAAMLAATLADDERFPYLRARFQKSNAFITQRRDGK